MHKVTAFILLSAALSASLAAGAEEQNAIQVDSTNEEITSSKCLECREEYGAVLTGFGVTGGAILWPADADQWSNGSKHAVGVQLRFAYERPRYRLDLTIDWMQPAWGTDEFDDYFMLGSSAGASWLMMDSSWSPYIGASLGVSLLNIGWNYDAGLHGNVHAGVELLRNKGSRLLMELTGYFPFFNVDSNRSAGKIELYGFVIRGGIALLF